jgi:4-hydroxy-3-methylbut-2-enyl diphosphate reductase
MLMSESLAIGEMFRAAMLDRYGEEALPRHFRAFDTICSATQERQDAVIALLDEQPLDLMLVVGGYNSSNTCNLARICAERVRTFHIADPECLISRDLVRHRPVGAPSTTAGREEATRDWLPRTGPLNVGLTAGASTPNNIVGHVIKQLEAFSGASSLEA